jgi:hypothetical protein
MTVIMGGPSNTANTNFKLTDLWNVDLFTFNITTGGEKTTWQPDDENIGTILLYKDTPTYYDIKMEECLGLDSQQITLQGTKVSDNDKYLLNSIVARQQLMKFWIDDDWFYYVLGVKPGRVRDVLKPLMSDFQVALEAVDPRLFYANLGGGTGIGYNMVVPNFNGFQNAGSGTVTVDLTTTNDTADILPVFWITARSGSVSSVQIQSNLGRTLVYTPWANMAAGEVHVIMPYRNSVERGFIPDFPTGFKLSGVGLGTNYFSPNTSAGYAATGHYGGTWAMDLLQHGYGTDSYISNANANAFAFLTTSGGYHQKGTIVLTSETYAVKRWNPYPLALDGQSGNAFTVAATGGNIDCYAQWCIARI